MNREKARIVTGTFVLVTWNFRFELTRSSQKRSTYEKITYELKEKGDAKMLAEGTSPEESEHYDLAGNYEMLTAGIMRYVERCRKDD